jgi:hypothetical protein
MKSIFKKKFLLSKKGQELILHYKNMVENGYKRTDGSYIKNTYESFELKKFQKFILPQFNHFHIKSVLDYGSGGSNWDKNNFIDGRSAKDFFNLDKVINYEPSRNLDDLQICDCVICFDVLEHVYINDLNKILKNIYSYAKKLVVIQVACYEAAALLPTGENAHITQRPPMWWKGFIDNISIDFPQISTMLFCSTRYTHVELFKIWKNSDYDEKAEYTVKLE